MVKHSKSVEAKWQKIISEFNSSGLSPVEFCQNRTFNINTFYTWRKRIKNLNSSNPNFHELNFQESSKCCSSNGSIDIYINDNIRIKVTDGFSESLLQRTLKVLSNVLC